MRLSCMLNVALSFCVGGGVEEVPYFIGVSNNTNTYMFVK